MLNRIKEYFTNNPVIVLVSLIAVTAISATIITLLISKFTIQQQPTVVTVDLQEIVQEFVADVIKSEAKPEEIEELVVSFSTTLEVLMKNIAQQENLIIIPAQASLGGTIDITKQVKATLEVINASEK